MSTPNTTSQPDLQPSLEAQASSLLACSDEEKAQLKALLAEARNTRDVLVGFRAAVEGGTYHGGKMLDIAKGLAFLEAILQQNNAHIHNLQERQGA